MFVCLGGQLAIRKARQERKTMLPTKQIPITSMSKNVKHVH